MTHSGDSDEAIATALMDLAENEKLVPRVRYNALRALERVHPCAPRPYFRHVSDWGMLDYAELEKIARQSDAQRPSVMRGHGKREPTPGRHWAWISNSGLELKSSELKLQREISSRLAVLLRTLLNSAGTNPLPDSERLEGVALNASHAWIRWFHESDREPRRFANVKSFNRRICRFKTKHLFGG